MSEISEPEVNLLDHLQQIKEKSPELGQLLTIYETIFKGQSRTKAGFRPDLELIDIPRGREKNTKEFSFLSKDDIILDRQLFEDLVADICRGIREQAPEPEKDALWTLALPPGEEGLKRILSGFMEDRTLLPDLAKGIGADPEKFTFITGQALVPFMEKYAEPVREQVNFAQWTQGSCPVCGSEPLMGSLEEKTGKRYLTCYLCRTEWPFGRLECPFCGNNNQHSLRYFYDEDGDQSHRVEVCDQCRVYLKVVDQRKAGKRMPIITENLATLQLDIIAKREGFHRDTNRLFGL